MRRRFQTARSGKYLAKANRFVAFLDTDRRSRGLPPCGDDMRLVTRDDYVRYKEHLLKLESGYSHTTVKHHLDDLRTLFIFASKNRSFANPTDEVTRLKRKNGRNKWRPYTLGERVKILTAARKEGAGCVLVPVGSVGDGFASQ